MYISNHDRFPNSPPVILGHEFSGVVEQIGPGVKVVESSAICLSPVIPDCQKALKLLSEKKVETAPLITHRFQIERWKDAFATLEKLEAIRPVFLIGCNSNRDRCRYR